MSDTTGIPAPPETPHWDGFRRGTFEIGWRNGYRDGRAGKEARPTDAGFIARSTREAEHEGYHRGYRLGLRRSPAGLRKMRDSWLLTQARDLDIPPNDGYIERTSNRRP